MSDRDSDTVTVTVTATVAGLRLPRTSGRAIARRASGGSLCQCPPGPASAETALAAFYLKLAPTHPFSAFYERGLQSLLPVSLRGSRRVLGGPAIMMIRSGQVYYSAKI